jgi:anti-sigma regulatory factor (Ser/Thr protein kinase)
MSTTTSELRIPADPSYIVVAKRAAAGFAYIAGFGVEAVDDLCIAVAQACENAISCASRAGTEPAQVRIVFKLQDQRLDVQVLSSCQRATVSGEATPRPEPAKVPEPGTAVTAAQKRAAELQQAHVQDLALRMMGLFVDDMRYRVDAQTGTLRVRMTKYRVS